MSQGNRDQMPRRVADYYYDASGDWVQAVDEEWMDEENPYENNHFPDVDVVPTIRGTHPSARQPENNDEKPRQKLSSFQIAIICALALNFALAACGIVLFMLEKSQTDGQQADSQMQKQTNGTTDKKFAEIIAQINDLQMHKQTNDEVEKKITEMKAQINDIQMLTQISRETGEKFAEAEAMINGSLHILDDTLRKHERLSSNREISHAQTRKEILSDLQLQKEKNTETEEKFAEIKTQLNASRKLIDQRLRYHNRLFNSRNTRNDLTNARIFEELRAIKFGLQNQSDLVEQKLEDLKNMATGITGIRLVGGSLNYGRVEVLHNGVWGTICDDDWNLNDAKVVCRMLGYKSATSAPGGATYGKGTGKIWLDNVHCSGTEEILWVCPKNPWGNQNRNHNEDASVVCAR